MINDDGLKPLIADISDDRDDRYQIAVDVVGNTRESSRALTTTISRRLQGLKGEL
jgi:hypothetical protein